jgi:hypothetical protein
MKYLVAGILASLFAEPAGTAQDPPGTIRVGLVELLASPQKYEGKTVAVRGFLLILGGHHDIATYLLYLSKEDAENELDNCLLVVPNEQMQRDREKLDRMYVGLAGSVVGRRVANGGYVWEIKNVKDCSVWSDPSRPRLLQHGTPKASDQR